MKAWQFRLESNPAEISKKLVAKLGSNSGFVFSLDDTKNNSMTFRIRKRILYAWYWAFQNWTIINGRLLKTDIDSATNVEISFSQHILIRLILCTHIVLGLGLLIAIVSGIMSRTPLYIVGGILLALGILLWVSMQLKFEKDIQNYKSLISEILGL